MSERKATPDLEISAPARTRFRPPAIPGHPRHLRISPNDRASRPVHREAAAPVGAN